MKKILVVDDQEVYLSSLSFALQKYFEVVLASSKAEAMERLKSEVDIALVDVRLIENQEGNIDGIRLLEWIMLNKPTVSVFMMSAYREFFYEEESLKLGAKYFFHKPIDIVSLVRLLMEKS